MTNKCFLRGCAMTTIPPDLRRRAPNASDPVERATAQSVLFEHQRKGGAA